jgi:hypothetical protein
MRSLVSSRPVRKVTIASATAPITAKALRTVGCSAGIWLAMVAAQAPSRVRAKAASRARETPALRWSAVTDHWAARSAAALGDEPPEDLFQDLLKVHASALVRRNLRRSLLRWINLSRHGRLVKRERRARWRRCFAFSLALRLVARIVLLDLAVVKPMSWTSGAAARTGSAVRLRIQFSDDRLNLSTN